MRFFGAQLQQLAINNIGAIFVTMSILKDLKQKAQQILNKYTSQSSTNIESLETQLLALKPTLEPVATFPNLNQVQSKEPQLVYVSLTVQDILDVQYYYAFLIGKPVSKSSQIYILKYGANDKELENIAVDNYHTVMDSRQTLVCVSEFYGSRWLHQQWKGPVPIQKPVEVKISGKHDYKLGQKITAVCVWNPEDSYLTFVRKSTPEQIYKNKLNYEQSALKQQQPNYKQMKQILLENLQQFSSQPQSLMTIFSMISDEPMFINNLDISQQLSEILPRVCHIKIKAPFKQSLFPYKNEDSKLIQTPMQLSMSKTFVIIDFSEFSNEKQIKIHQQEIDNLKALKVFVEEGKTVYRWEYGQSLNDHIHCGVIVKGSKIVNPHFYIGQQLIEKEKSKNNPFKQMDFELKQKIRKYIQRALKVKPQLSDESRKKIELDIDQQMKDFPERKLNVPERMLIARLSAKSMGKTDIEIEDYILAKDILKANN